MLAVAPGFKVICGWSNTGRIDFAGNRLVWKTKIKIDL
jgi:hypothetical protein